MHPTVGLDPQGPPLPTRQIMHQWWRDITFAHWRVDPERVAPLLPDGVRPDVHDGSSWVGLIPFHMVGAGVGRGSRAIPRFGTFLETNVRLYSIDDQGRQGVVFCSLEAEGLAVVAGANASFGVPYKWARMSREPRVLPTDPTGTRISYRTRRRTAAHPQSSMDVEIGALLDAPTALDLFLTSRFGLHTSLLGQTLWIPNTHGPWPLRAARVTALADDLVEAAGLPGVTTSRPESVLFSSGVRTVFGLPQRVA